MRSLVFSHEKNCNNMFYSSNARLKFALECVRTFFFIFSALYEQTGKAMKTKTSATQVHSNCLQCFQLKLRRWLRAET